MAYRLAEAGWRDVVLVEKAGLPAEAVRLDGEVIGRLRSAAYGYTVERTVGTTYLPAAVPKGTRIDVDVFAERIGGSVATDVLVDAAGIRMRG